MYWLQIEIESVVELVNYLYVELLLSVVERSTLCG